MQKRLRKIVVEQKLKANITAGLGSVFVALANRHLAANGRIALVLPKAMLNGVACKTTHAIKYGKNVTIGLNGSEIIKQFIQQ